MNSQLTATIEAPVGIVVGEVRGKRTKARASRTCNALGEQHAVLVLGSGEVVRALITERDLQRTQRIKVTRQCSVAVLLLLLKRDTSYHFGLDDIARSEALVNLDFVNVDRSYILRTAGARTRTTMSAMLGGE